MRDVWACGNRKQRSNIAIGHRIFITSFTAGSEISVRTSVRGDPLFCNDVSKIPSYSVPFFRRLFGTYPSLAHTLEFDDIVDVIKNSTNQQCILVKCPKDLLLPIAACLAYWESAGEYTTIHKASKELLGFETKLMYGVSRQQNIQRIWKYVELLSFACSFGDLSTVPTSPSLRLQSISLAGIQSLKLVTPAGTSTIRLMITITQNGTFVYSSLQHSNPTCMRWDKACDKVVQKVRSNHAIHVQGELLIRLYHLPENMDVDHPRVFLGQVWIHTTILGLCSKRISIPETSVVVQLSFGENEDTRESLQLEADEALARQLQSSWEEPRPRNIFELVRDDGDINQSASPMHAAALPVFPCALDSKFCGDMCLICRDTFVGGQVLKMLPCLHPYHLECADMWLRRSVYCPVCQTSIVDVHDHQI